MTDDTQAEGSDRRAQLRTVVRYGGVLALLLFVLPFVVYAVPQVVGAQQSYVVLSGSMEPTMSPGDVVLVEDVEAAQIEEGDIITFRHADDTNPTTHRVIERIPQDDGVVFRTKGDANEDPDRSVVEPQQIQGRVATFLGSPFVIPYIGHVTQFASSTLGFVSLVLVPLVLLFVTEAWSMLGHAGSDDDDAEPEPDAESVRTVETGATDPPDGTVGDASVDSDGPVADVGPVSAEPAAGESSRVVEATIETPPDEETDDGDGITFTVAELELGTVALGVFAAYSVWVAVDTLDAWAFTVAGSVAAAFLFVTTLYLGGRRGEDAEASAGQQRRVRIPVGALGAVPGPTGTGGPTTRRRRDLPAGRARPAPRPLDPAVATGIAADDTEPNTDGVDDTESKDDGIEDTESSTGDVDDTESKDDGVDDTESKDGEIDDTEPSIGDVDDTEPVEPAVTPGRSTPTAFTTPDRPVSSRADDGDRPVTGARQSGGPVPAGPDPRGQVAADGQGPGYTEPGSDEHERAEEVAEFGAPGGPADLPVAVAVVRVMGARRMAEAVEQALDEGESATTDTSSMNPFELVTDGGDQ